MKKMIMLLCAAQVAAGAPATGAELHSDRSGAGVQTGSFAGARLRIPLGGGGERSHVGLALTSVQRTRDSGAIRFSRGAELGFSAGEAVSVKLGGRPVSQLAPGRRGPEGRKQGFSTLGWVAIGASLVIIVGGVLILDYISDQSE